MNLIELQHDLSLGAACSRRVTLSGWRLCSFSEHHCPSGHNGSTGLDSIAFGFRGMLTVRELLLMIFDETRFAQPVASSGVRPYRHPIPGAWHWRQHSHFHAYKPGPLADGPRPRAAAAGLVPLEGPVHRRKHAWLRGLLFVPDVHRSAGIL